MSDTPVAFSARDVNWELAPAEGSSSRPLVQLLVKQLPTIENTELHALVRESAYALTDQDEDMRTVKEVLSASLTQQHHSQALIDKQKATIRRLRENYAALINERREDRSAA